MTGQMISIRAHPVAKLYCTNLMAMKLVVSELHVAAKV